MEMPIYLLNSGSPFFDRGLNAAAGSEEADPPFSWLRLPATIYSGVDSPAGAANLT